MRHVIPLLLAAPLALAALPARAQVMGQEACANAFNGNGACTVRFTAQPGVSYAVTIGTARGSDGRHGTAQASAAIGPCGGQGATQLGAQQLNAGQAIQFAARYRHPVGAAPAALCATVALTGCRTPQGAVLCNGVLDLAASRAIVLVQY